jgi:O-antigen ligase
LSLVGLALSVGLGTYTARQHFQRYRGVEVEANRGPAEMGVNATLEQYDAYRLAELLALVEQAGFRYVRQTFAWADIEPRPGKFAWQPWDSLVNAVEQHGLGVIAVLDTSPAWARREPIPDWPYICEATEKAADSDGGRNQPPTRPEDYAEFVRALVARYRGRLAAVQLWDEPNIAPNWRVYGPDAPDYVRLLAAGSRAARQADPRALVLPAGLAPTVEASVCNLSDVAFLRSMLLAGAAQHIDRLAVHPFSLPSEPGGPQTGPDDRRVHPDIPNFSRVILLREVLNEYGRRMPVWATAWGWNALPPDWTGRPSPWGTADALTQVARLEAAYARARDEWPWLEVVILSHLQPRAPPDDPVWGFALLDHSGRPTALFEAASRLARNPGPPEPPPPDGFLAKMLAVASMAVVAGYGAARSLPLVSHGHTATVRASWARLGTPDGPLAAAGLVAIVVLMVLAPWPASAIALPLSVGVMAMHPVLGLAAIVASTPFYTIAANLGPRPVSLTELLTLSALAAWLLTSALPIAHAVRRSGYQGVARRITVQIFASPVRLDLGVLVLAMWAALSPLWSERPGVAMREWRVVILEPAIFYLLVRQNARHDRHLVRLLDGLALAAFLASLHSLSQLISGDLVLAEGVARVHGPYNSPNNLALFLGRCLAPLVGLVIWSQSRARRTLYAGVGMLAGLALFLTFSRGAWLLGLPAVLLFLAWAGGPATRRLTLVAGVAAVLALLPLARTPRIASLLDTSQGTTLFFRLHLWQSSLDMIGDHPWLGVGLDNFLYLYRERYVHFQAMQERNLSHPHNALLDFWLRLGLPGVGLLVWMAGGGLWLGLRAIRRLEGERRGLAVAFTGTLVYALAHGLFDNVFFLPDLALVWMLALAGVVALAVPDDTRGPARAARA